MSNLEQYTPKANIAYLTWIMLWVNAIPDTAVLIDWPDCSFFKSDIIYNNHDIYSTLKSVENNHRVYYTGLTVNNVIKWHEEKVKKELLRMKDDKNINFIFITTFPMAEVLWIQYDMTLRDLWLEEKSIEIKWSIKKDWLDWYAEILVWLAKWLNLESVKKDKNSVSIIWNLFDRNEWDCKWNIEELKRILEKIWLKVNTIWLNWKWINNLKEVEKSEYIISLPYGRKAAQIVSKNIWAKLIETCLPFGIQNTEKFILDVWKEFWIEGSIIYNFIKEEKKYIYDKISFSIRDIFFDKKMSFILDPNLIEWLINYSEILWFDIETIVWVSNKWKREEIINGYNINYWIEFSKIKITNNDLVIKNSIHRFSDNEIDFWFPNITNHYFYNSSYLWFNWSINFINLLVNYFLKIDNSNEN